MHASKYCYVFGCYKNLDTPPHNIFDMLRTPHKFLEMMSFKNSFLEAAEII